MNLTEKLKELSKDEFKDFSLSIVKQLKKIDSSLEQIEESKKEYLEAKKGLKSLLRNLLWEREMEEEPEKDLDKPFHVFCNERGKLQLSLEDIDEDAREKIIAEVLEGIPRVDRYYNRHTGSWEIKESYKKQVYTIAYKYDLNVIK